MGLRNNVKDLVRKYPHCIDKYNLMVVYYWREYEGATTFEDVADCSSPESITRAFRKAVEEGEITLTSKQKQIRKQSEMNYRRKYSA